MLRRILMICIAAGILTDPGGLARASSIKIRFTHQFPETHFVAKEVRHFAGLVEQKSAGKVVLEIFPAAQAYKPAEVIEAVVTGAIEAGMTTNMDWSGIIPAMDVFVVPYLITSYPVIEAALSGEVGKKLFQLMEGKGVKPLLWFFQTRTMVYTSRDKPLKLPEDFRGKKMRGTSKIMNKGVEALGASPVSVSGPEVYMALQHGTIDIGLTDVSAALARHYYEVHKYATVTNDFAVSFVAFMNPKLWNSIPPDGQKAIMDAARETQAKTLKDSEIEKDKSINELKAKGMILHIQTPEEAKAWEKATAPVLDYFLQTAGAPAKELVEIIRKLKAQ